MGGQLYNCQRSIKKRYFLLLQMHILQSSWGTDSPEKARVLGRYLWWNALSGVSWIFSASVQHFLHNELWWCPKIQILRHASMACATVHRYHCCHLTFWRNSVQSKTSSCCWPTCKSIIAQLQSAQWSLWMFNLPPWRKTSIDKLHTCQLWHCTLH